MSTFIVHLQSYSQILTAVFYCAQLLHLPGMLPKFISKLF